MSSPFRPPKTFGRPVRRHAQVFADRGGWGLSDLMSKTLEPAYYETAARRDVTGRPGDGGKSTVLLLVGLMLAGLIVAVAYQETSRTTPDRVRAREALIEQIDESRNRVGELVTTSSALRAEVTTLQEDALGTSVEGQELLDQVAALEAATAQQPVTGPGIVLVVGNPAPSTGSDPVGGGAGTAGEALITDRDLARAVNALWQAGAEAISINGHRLGPTTPIRQAGGAILVDFLPVSSPYTIQAIGPVASLGADFASTAIGRRFATYRTAYEATFSIENAQGLTLEAGTEPSVSYATATR